MTGCFVDEETGESLGHSPLRGCSPMLGNSLGPANPVNNAETGEPELEDAEEKLLRRRVPFQIPRALQKQATPTVDDERNRKIQSRMKPAPTGAPFGQTNPIILFLPAVFYFRWVIAIVMCLEVTLHVWAHHKNKRLKNSTVYFRSPLHSITSEFCALCISETCMNRVGKIQEIRSHKVLRQCNYMKRVVT